MLACAEEGASVTGVARRFGVSREMVRKWRSRFLEQRMSGLVDAPRPGAPRKITDEQVEVVVARTLNEKGPGKNAHWSTRSMAAGAGMSQTAISRIWRALGLKPHLTETWKLSSDPEFIGRVRDAVGLYLSPPENALVLVVDEKSQSQAIDRSAPYLPLLTTTPERMTHDHVRNGNMSMFAACDTSSWPVIAQHCGKRRYQEFPRFLKLIDDVVPGGLDLHLILDNYATCKASEVQKWLLRHPRFHLHVIPARSSWLDLVERWFAELTRRKLRSSTRRAGTELEADICAWASDWTKNPRPFIWTRGADEILETLAAAVSR